MKTVTDENRLSVIYPEIAKEWDYDKNKSLTPHDVSYGSNRKVWWICAECGYEWEAKIANRSFGRGCPCCANKVVVSGVNDLATRNPSLAQEWHPTRNGDITPDKVMLGTAKKVWWLCPYGHSYQASVLHRGHGTNCPDCNAGRQTSFAEKAVFYYIKKIYPDAIHRDVTTLGNRMELDIYIPSLRLAIEYDGAFWHDSKKAKEREQSKFERCQELGINLLRIKEKVRPLGEDTSRWTLFADPTGHNKNLDDVIRQILEKIDPNYSFWTRKTLYPIPSVTVDTQRDRFDIIGALIEKYDWSQEYPQLVQEWHPTKNEGRTLDMFSRGSDEKVWWMCSECHREWEASISHRVMGTGCSVCYRKRNRGKGHCLARTIYQYTQDGQFVREWDCVSDVSRELGINTSNITMCAKGTRKSAGGFVWRYEKL